MEGFEKTCPYCGQEVMDEGDARKNCGCHAARKYRKMVAALEDQSENAHPMRPIEDPVMVVLRELAHLCCAHKIDGAAVSVVDGTAVKIGGKVSRTVQIKYEKKVGG